MPLRFHEMENFVIKQHEIDICKNGNVLQIGLDKNFIYSVFSLITSFSR